MNFSRRLHPVVQALLATGFTWGVTALGASFIFLRREPSQKLLDTMLGFAGGVMVAASYWSLLSPAIDMSEGKSVP
jgi:ZIP family zinc transporter